MRILFSSSSLTPPLGKPDENLRLMTIQRVVKIVGWAKRSVPIIPTTPIHPKNPPCHYEHYAVTHLMGTGTIPQPF